MMSDPYLILGVDRQANDAAIRLRYLTLVREFPPEQHPARFAEIRAAFERIQTIDARIRTIIFEEGRDETLGSVADAIAQKTTRPRIAFRHASGGDGPGMNADQIEAVLQDLRQWMQQASESIPMEELPAELGMDPLKLAEQFHGSASRSQPADKIDSRLSRAVWSGGRTTAHRLRGSSRPICERTRSTTTDPATGPSRTGCL